MLSDGMPLTPQALNFSWGLYFARRFTKLLPAISQQQQHHTDKQWEELVATVKTLEPKPKDVLQHVEAGCRLTCCSISLRVTNAQD
jgi:hypothetical protein